MVELHIKIRKRIARLAYGENFVSYNEGYKIIFDFDKEWDNIENKIARFILGENYIDCPFSGNEVEIPLIKNEDTLEIGVYSDGLYTTTPVKFKVLKSIKDEEKIEILVPEIYPEIEELDDEDLIKVYDKSEEKIGISPLKKLFDKTKVTIDDALAAAKASGEFDGADGKSAYQYAQEGGYTGTETEFAEKLAEEQLTGTTGSLTPTQVYDAVSAGIPVKVQYFDDTYGVISFTAFNVSESINVIASQIIAYFNGVYILCELFGEKSSNRWGFNVTTLAQKTDIPMTLPNPNALTFKIGGTTVTYDGSTAQTVTIADGTEVLY